MLKMGTKNIIQIYYHFTSYIFNSSYRLEGKFVKPGKYIQAISLGRR